MHSAVLSHLQKDPRQLLARFASGTDETISIVGAYVSGADHPVWVAKTSTSEPGRNRLRKERDALAALAPWSSQFGIPQLIHYEDQEPTACLILSGVPGFPSQFDIGTSERLPAAVLDSLAWLDRFQQAVTPPTRMLPSAMVEQVANQLESRFRGERTVAELVAYLRTQMPRDSLQQTASHGDFWRGNVLFSQQGISVIDWDELQTGFVLDDVFTFVLSCVPFQGRELPATETLRYTFFSGSPCGRYLKSRVRELGLSLEQARYAFYWFVAKRFLWKEFAADWKQFLEQMCEQGLPVPTSFA